MAAGRPTLLTARYGVSRTAEAVYNVRKVASAPLTEQHTTVCIAGGGPAGLMLGLLLARAGVHVTVLEKHRDFPSRFPG